MNKQNFKKAFYVVTSLFFMWGLITVLVDSLIPRLKEVFEISYFQALLLQVGFFGAYGLLSIPAGNILHKIGYKRGMMLGLGIMGVGSLMFYPAASLRMFPFFILGYFTLAAGMVLLQVAANPYVTVLGDSKGAASRLNLSQAFNSLGTAIAPIFGAIFLLSDNIKSSIQIEQLDALSKEAYYSSEASAVQTPFVVLAGLLILLALIVLKSQLPQVLSSGSNTNYKEAWKSKRLKYGAFGIFVYVGAEVGISSLMVNYFLDMNLAEVIKNSIFMKSIAELFLSDGLVGVDNKAIVGAFVFFYWLGAMIGRFFGSWLTHKYSPSKVLGVFAVGAISFVLLSIFTDGLISMWSIIGVGLFNSVMFPTIFSIASDRMGDLKPEASGILCTAIVGGGIISALTGLFTDLQGFKMAFFLIVLCYAYIWFYAHKSKSFT